MPTDAPLGWIAVAAFAALAAIVQTLRIAGARWLRRRALDARFSRARVGEARAEPLLRAAGYEIIGRQVAGSWTLRADGEPIDVALRADLLVARGAQRFVAEVKTGRLAPRLDHAPTRRQLLEYKHAFDVDGVLLVDAEADRIVVVDLDGAPAGPTRSVWAIALALGVGLAVGVGVGVGIGVGVGASRR